MAAYIIEMVARDQDGLIVASAGRLVQVGGVEPDFVQAAEAMHDELIDTEDKAEAYCQHR